LLIIANNGFLELATKPATFPTGVADVTGVSRVVGKEREVLTISDAVVETSSYHLFDSTTVSLGSVDPRA